MLLEEIFSKHFDAVLPMSLRLFGGRRQGVALTSSYFSSFLFVAVAEVLAREI